MEIRKKITPQLPENSIYFLPFMDAERSTDLIKQDIEIVEDIKDVSALKASTQKYLTAKSEGKRIIEKNMLREFLSEIKYPVYYFDYETSQSLIPPWEGTRPYQQVPFQYSLHVLRGP